MTKQQFLASAPLTVKIGDAMLYGKPKTVGEKGNVGYGIVGKVMLQIDGEWVEFQCGLNITAIKSANWAEGAKLIQPQLENKAV